MSSQSESSADTQQTSENLSRKSRGVYKNGVHIVTVAELNWRNGHEYAMEAVKLLKDRGFHVKYTLVGNGPFLEAVGFARYQLGLMDEVQMILDDMGGEDYLRDADLFMLASVAEGASHALEAAISNGIPVVCSDLESFIAASNEYPQRRKVNRRDPEALAKAVMDLLSRDGDSGNARRLSPEITDDRHSFVTGKTLGST